MTLCAYSWHNSQVLVSKSGLVKVKRYTLVMFTAEGDLAVLQTALCILKFTCYECDSMVHQKSASITFVTSFRCTFVTPVTYAIPFVTGVTNVIRYKCGPTMLASILLYDNGNQLFAE